MTIVPLFMLTLGAINWGYVYPLVFLFVALLRQRLLGKEICFNFLYASSFWLLLAAGMTYAIIGPRSLLSVYHHGTLPIIAFGIGWILAEGSSDEQIRDGILAMIAGFGTYAALNMAVNIGRVRYRLIDFWSRTYRAATGSGVLNTMTICAMPDIVKCEKRVSVKLLFLALFVATIHYMFMLGTRTQFAILLITILLAVLHFSNREQGSVGIFKFLAIVIVLGAVGFLIYRYDIFSIRSRILSTNLALRYQQRDVLESADTFRLRSVWVGLRELVLYPMGGRAGQVYHHNMWLDVGRVSGVIPFMLLLTYSIKNFAHVITVCKNRAVLLSLRYLLLFLYIGTYVNFFVEPIWEGALNLFLALCVVDGMVSAMIRREGNDSDSENRIPDTSNLHTDL